MTQTYQFELNQENIDKASEIAAKFLKDHKTEFINQDIVAPLNNTFLKMLSGISGPMIFLATIWGIYSVGDISAFSDIGKNLPEY